MGYVQRCFRPGRAGPRRRALVRVTGPLALAALAAGRLMALAPELAPIEGGPPEPVSGAASGAVGVVAHEIPFDVTVQAFVRPDRDRLTFVVRVPLEAMRDFDFPTTGPGYLDLTAAGPLLADAARLWIADYVTFYEGGARLPDGTLSATRISIPSDRSFATYEEAIAHVTGPGLPAATRIPWRQALLDILLEYPIASDEAEFSIDPRFAHLGLRTVTVLRFLPPDGAARAFQYSGDPGLVRLDPSWLQAAIRFVRLGFEHILDGIDHLLFLLCLVIPVRRFWGLLPVVTSFTVAHSITLIASAAGLAPGALWFPPLIETLIALSIVYMAIENIVGARPERRWMVAFGFGLVHGFGFSFVLRETLQFAGSHLVTSLLAFNFGVELGQMFVVALSVPVLVWLFRRVVAERVGTIVLSAMLAHTGWHWMTNRGSELLQYRVAWPALDASLAASLIRWIMLALIVGGAVWLVRGPFGRWAARDHRSAEART